MNCEAFGVRADRSGVAGSALGSGAGTFGSWASECTAEPVDKRRAKAKLKVWVRSSNRPILCWFFLSKDMAGHPKAFSSSSRDVLRDKFQFVSGHNFYLDFLGKGAFSARLQERVCVQVAEHLD